MEDEKTEDKARWLKIWIWVKGAIPLKDAALFVVLYVLMLGIGYLFEPPVLNQASAKPQTEGQQYD